MTFGIPYEWALLIGVLGCMGAFFVGQAMDGVMGQQGFGVVGNALVLIGGFLLGLAVIHGLGYRADSIEIVAVSAIMASFAALLVLAILKRMFMRV